LGNRDKPATFSEPHLKLSLEIGPTHARTHSIDAERRGAGLEVTDFREERDCMEKLGIYLISLPSVFDPDLCACFVFGEQASITSVVL
jgi:hypothetical protein